MKTITQLTSAKSTDAPDVRDSVFKPSNRFQRTVIEQADGYHAFYQLGDGQTTGHLFISRSDFMALFETADANFKVPKNTNGITSKQ